ncbi:MULTISPECIES: MerR family transcriptional regulator [Pseudomonas]|uniref:MerR family transcriptional regulator n=1 Tax=Pseudomonas TaxID=286 RepID=UPI001BECB6E6|nr:MULTISPECIES: MerR family transcriptional regulator [Pseudomonas]MBT2341185.1 MerR family transcriptional regulator [Pseudomonas fluorescens]MCD4531274.1 MerR family transcriptional regulator [Pseudomonas sp. C3-2018]
MTDATSTDLLPMRDVVNLTGINPVTLRAWERRHGLIRPQRTEGGHRLYTAQDVERIRDILRLTGGGLLISKVGEVLARQPEEVARPTALLDDSLEHWRTAVLRATKAFDRQALEGIHGQLFTVYPKVTVLLDVLIPVWRSLSLGNAFGQRSQWLFLDAFLRARLLLRLQLNQPDAPCVLLAGTASSTEFELLANGVLLSGERRRIEVLGCGQPLEELRLLCATLRPAALVLDVPGGVDAALAKRLRSLQMEISCPLALMGSDLADSRAVLKDIPLALLDGRSVDAGLKLEALLRGALEL